MFNEMIQRMPPEQQQRAQACLNWCESMWNKLPSLESEEQRQKGLYSTTRKVLSCLPWVGVGMFCMSLIQAVNECSTSNERDPNNGYFSKYDAYLELSGISLIRYLGVSTVSLIAIKVATIVSTGVFAVGVVSSGCLILAIPMLAYMGYEIGARRIIDMTEGV